MVLNCIDFDGADRNVCRDFFDELRGQVNSETLKKMVDSTVYGTDESEEGK